MSKSESIISVLVIVIVLTIGFFLYRNKESKNFELVLQIQNYKANEQTEAAGLALSKALSSPELKVKITFTQKNLKELLAENSVGDNYLHAGIFSSGNITRADLYGKIIEPLYTISPDKKQECFSESEINVSKNSKIKNLEQLNGKSIAVTSNGVRSIPLFFPEFKKLDIHFGKIVINADPQWALDNLAAKKIDAIFVTKIIIDDSGLSEAALTDLTLDAKITGNNQVKIFNTTQSQFPCSMFFVNKQLPTAIKQQLVKNLNTALANPELSDEFYSAGRIGSIKPLSLKNLDRIRTFIFETSQFSLEDFTKNLFNSSLRKK